MNKARFEAQVIEGHKGVRAVLLPFDPEALWKQKPVRLAGRRHGWLVKGTVNGEAFTGYVGDRWGRYFIALDDDLVAAAGISIGDEVSVTLEGTKAADVYRRACEQSKVTTQPKKARSDALVFEEASAASRATATKRPRSAKP